MSKINLSSLATKWPSTIVARRSVREFTGGLLSPKTLANLDSQGEGPDGRFCCNGQVCYSADKLVEWLEKRDISRNERRERQ